jgi:hypothetical protein
MQNCTFLLLTSPRDREFVIFTLPHLLRMCSFPFYEVIVVIDDLPKGRPASDFSDECGKFFSLVEGWQSRGLIGRFILLSEISFDDITEKYFGTNVLQTRDYRGVPLFGWVAGLEVAKSEFVVHFDSDILLFQASDYSWINDGMTLISDDPDAMFVSPLPGPPAIDGRLRGQVVAPTLDTRGNFRFKTFSSRRFLVNKVRLGKLLPTPLRRISEKQISPTDRSYGTLCSWEDCVSSALQSSEFYRINLRCPKAWSVHSPEHNRDWLMALPRIVRCIENGDYPAKQGGHYELLLSAWYQLLRS